MKEVKFMFINKENDTYQSFQKNVRQILLKAGYAPDVHISSLTPVFLESRRNNPAVNFIIRLRKFIYSLDPLEASFFESEILEGGRHYPFLYINVLSDNESKKLKRELFYKAKEELKELA